MLLGARQGEILSKYFTCRKQNSLIKLPSNMKTAIITIYILLLEYVYAELVDEKRPSFSSSTVTDDDQSSRYLVKFKKDSAMMGNIRMRAASPNNLFGRPSSSAIFSLPKEEIVVMELDSTNDVEYWETRDDVEAVELGTILMNIINSTECKTLC